ncbi:hypothetical protein PpBr36_07543 [Pyricularia pennisetigena]|uniref:hypothetical protein n=1 Tax=Pyricularia pennisetigena TaxID=1578925 RepID=UPI0011515B99|nr:hypothetical protein PpBr36_07543 [Pyricularia pennisetigena]TLS25500.1 hypothetical protein PpBr36_07543 [Pyricularia pennisetigena]
MSSLRFGSIPKIGRSEEKSVSSKTNPSKSTNARGQGSVDNWTGPAVKSARPDMDTSRFQTPGVPSSSRIPPGPARKPQPRQGSSRPPLTHQDKSWGSSSTQTIISGPARSTSESIPVPSTTPVEEKKRPVRNVLRRRSSNMIQEAVEHRKEIRIVPQRNDSASSVPRSVMSPESFTSSQYDRSITESPAEIQVAMRVELPTTNAQTVRIYPELDRYGGARPYHAGTGSSIEVPYPLSTHDLPPPTPLFSGTSSQISGYSGSPSTGFSGSPGICPYSRDTTPTTSIPSQSPALVAPGRFAATKMKQNSPASGQSSRPPVTRRRAGSIPNEASGAAGADPHGLAVVREALNSSSSGSTVRGGDRKAELEPEPEGGKRARRRLGTVPPSPPPRTSSEKHKDRGPEASPSKQARQPAPLMMTSQTTEGRAQKPTVSRIQPPSPSVLPRATPPIRPSRDGTPDLLSQYGMPMPIIQSNLSSTSIGERRQSLPMSPGANTIASPRYQGARSATPSQLPPPSKLPHGREPTPAPRTVETRRPSHGSATSRSPSPGITNFRTRFLFGRRKTAGDEPSKTSEKATEKKEKPLRKGPAAGTGHEGYGRVGMPHRRRSSLSRGIAGTMSSQESLESRLSDDPFLQERTKPVVIAGGEVVQNNNIGSAKSDQNLPAGASRNMSDISLSSQGDRNTLWPSPFPKASTTAGRRQSDVSDSEGPALEMRSTLAYRRSMQKLKDGGDQSALRLPKPINTRSPREITSPTMTSHDTSILSDDSIIEMTTGRVLQGPRATPSASVGPKKLTKRARSPRKWNIFGRSSSQVPSTTSREPTPVESRKVTAQVQVKPAPKAKAFYTMDMSEQEDNGDPAAAAQKALLEAQLLESPPQQPVQPQPPTHPHIPPMGRRQSVRRSVTSPMESRRGGLDEVPAQTGASKLPMGPGKRASLTKSKPSEIAPRGGVVSPQLRSPPTTIPAYRRTSVNRAVSADQDAKRGGLVDPAFQVQKPQQTSKAERYTTPTQESPAPSTEPAILDQQPATRRAGRPSRLPQVGRIPKVVSARPEPTSPKSFSRPFHRISLLPPSRDETGDITSIAKGPSPPKTASPEPEPAECFSDEEMETTTVHDTQAVTNSPQRLSREMTPDIGKFINDFLSFPPRKNSHSTSCTTTSSSSNGMYCYADATAVVPAPNAPLAEDEVWLEYDDLIGEEGLRVPASPSSSHGTPFHLEEYAASLTKPGGEQLESPTFSPHPAPHVEMKDDAREDKHEKEPIPSSIYSTDETNILNEALEMGIIPISSPFVTQDFNDYNEAGRQKQTLPPRPQAVAADTAAVSSASTRAAAAQRSGASSSVSDSPRRRNNKRVSVSSGSSGLSDDNSPLSQVNLRVGSMTVSKWLTFGHVLFSPVRDELVPVDGSLKRHSILVIDGLGNDDWSFYAAETYPEATFFNLSPRAPLPKPSQKNAEGSFPLSPPNHHQIQYKSHMDKFPFGAESFIAVVFRFPAAAPEAAFRNIVAEAHRVLKPGGFIELSILDLDLNNMGNRSRRMVRRLKERIHAVAPETCLSSTADLLLKLVGRKGFVDIKSCRVGVPVASATPGGPPTASNKAKNRRKDERSLAEMISDDGPVADESITKMVAKVGRWWFSRCYENGVLGANSMWNDRCLLGECEEWGTSLKLMVCHARVPDARTRVASI